MSKKSDIWLPKSLKPDQWWLCLWRDAEGRYVVNENYEHLSMQTRKKNDPTVEKKMREAAESYGVYGGSAVWREGRQITQTEWEVQMERMQDGLIPDEREAVLAQLEEEYVEDLGHLPRELD